MPRKPRKQRAMRRPGPGNTPEYKQRWMDAENKRLASEGSGWRYTFGANPSNSETICLTVAKSSTDAD